MLTTRTLAELRDHLQKPAAEKQRSIVVCDGPGCHAAGSPELAGAFEEQIQKACGPELIELRLTGCLGLCQCSPVVLILPDNIFYTYVSPADAGEILDHILKDKPPVERLLYQDPDSQKRVSQLTDIPFYKHQNRRLLSNNTFIRPESIDDYIRCGGYGALAESLTSSTPEEVIEVVKASGLRGRGGAGFPSGLKWEFCRKAAGDKKYVICNADEGDPGAYMDRAVLEGNPHSVLEGMLIGGYAMGASESIIYCRAEYPIAVHNSKQAIEQARQRRLIGKNILGTGFDFEISVKTGAGAFVCGEETALIASLEDLPGEPRPKPPFPAQSGLWGQPTNINNVETWANIPLIINRGAEWYRSVGAEKCPGTKIFSLVGKVRNAGLVEVPIGISLRELIFDIGGGPLPGRKIKAVQIGGPSGGCIPAHLLDLPVDYENLSQAGAIMGSGGVIVMDDRTCMVDVSKYFLEFLKEESCGKCVPCREGIPRMLEILDRITKGDGRNGDIELLEEIGTTVKQASLCGLGQTAANPLLSSIRYFRNEYEAHIRNKSCPAAVCRTIISSPCQHLCPLGTDVPAYVSLIGKQQYLEAVKVIAEPNPLPNVCARVCHHPCEGVCSCGEAGEPLAIRPLKRVALDHAIQQGQWPPKENPEAQRPERVAVVGSGPAGLAAAFFLARKGCRVTVFEAEDRIGGALATAIPEYRLPQQALALDIQRIRNMGVTFKTGVKVGTDLTFEQLRKNHQAVFLGLGVKNILKLGIAGEQGTGVYDPLSFLKSVRNGHMEKPGDAVIVIGGGNVAMDVARTCVRLGAKKVVILYRRTLQEMPAEKEEIEQAMEEGVEIEFLLSPARIMRKSSKITGVACLKMQLDGMDKRGRRRTIPVEGKEIELRADAVIPAIGQALEDSVKTDFPATLVSEWNLLKADPETCATEIPGVFAGGDAVTGPATVTQAMADGIRAAQSMLQYFDHKSITPSYSGTRPGVEVDPIEITEMELDALLEQTRPNVPAVSVAERKHCFCEVELMLSAPDAVNEAKRCLRCDRQG
ncbi:NADH-quinone oxidoreductase subunit NuoF [uncultured Desulfobacter sp.]|uniref:NADH-quinone oxidoreductase subunit NuoF n=1 Tax=uncultured Desulfobacter sp. TaxID=240139 RepID=UPI002AAA8114|nr:NADH-quinone oxidoreductase subunit NuoF [uncultured Desulfobacter sp.]